MAFTEAIIRFFNNRAVRVDEQVSYLRLQIEKEKDNNSQLLDIIKSYTTGSIEKEEPINTEDFKPIQYKESWSAKRSRLERAARQKAFELDREARIQVERNKSTEQLEDELLHGEG